VPSDGHSVERIVVDGGSEDATTAIAEREGCRIIRSDRAHRAHQLNLGASAARANVFLFLHADTRLPEKGVRQILDSMANPKIAGGGFERSFDTPSAILKFTCRLAAWRSRRWGIFLGDQGIFVRRRFFEVLGGFDEDRSIAEDLDFSLRLKKQGEVIALPGPAISSARRFENKGPLRQSLIDFWLAAKFLAGR
jgi:rSAM/selenodomain-associated transferase 2